jgi:protein-disulfide isomerase
MYIFKTFIIFILLSLHSFADDKNQRDGLVTIGSENAKIKIKLFSSFTCPHCATFHINEIPEIKKKYIETGIAQLIFVDFPLDQAAFNASKLTYCLDKKLQMEYIDIIYMEQNKWTSGNNINEINNNLKKIVKNLGISSSNFDKCLNNENISDNILNSRVEASKKYSINSTPTVIINEKKIKGSATFKNIKKLIDKII